MAGALPPRRPTPPYPLDTDTTTALPVFFQHSNGRFLTEVLKRWHPGVGLTFSGEDATTYLDKRKRCEVVARAGELAALSFDGGFRPVVPRGARACVFEVR